MAKGKMPAFLAKAEKAEAKMPAKAMAAAEKRESPKMAKMERRFGKK